MTETSLPDDAAILRRLAQVERRLGAIQTFWEDDNIYNRIVASGRYLKLCSVTEQATEAAETVRARAVAVLARLAASGREPQPALIEATRRSA